MLAAMEYQNPDQDGMSSPPQAQGAKPAGRTRRIVVSSAAAAVLLGAGAAAGIALTGGAAAATAGATATHHRSGGGQCHRRAARLRRSSRPAAAPRVPAFCSRSLLRIAAGGGIHGEVTFAGKPGSRTLAFERGTIQSVNGSVVTVKAADNTSWAWHILVRTIIREGGHQAAKDSLAVGDRVLVAGQVAAGAKDARLIRIRTTGKTGP
jgi:hypothetical protein